MSGWVGFDFDGTLARYNGWQGPDHVGDPVPLMLDRLKEHEANGDQVKIFTARASHDGTPESQRNMAKNILAIQDWCMKHVGHYLPITSEKDYKCWRIYDDRVVQVVANTGKIVRA